MKLAVAGPKMVGQGSKESPPRGKNTVEDRRLLGRTRPRASHPSQFVSAFTHVL